MQAVSIDPLRAAALGAALLAGLLALQYAHRRQPFIFLWAAGWLLIAATMLIVSREYGTPLTARVAVGVSQLLIICTATLFFWSGDLYRATRYVTPYRLRALIAVGIWFVFAPMIFGVRTVVIPGHVITALLLLAAGTMYGAVLLERHMIGAGLASFVLFGLAMSRLTGAAIAWHTGATSEPMSLQILLVNTILSALGVFGVHLFVFEDMTWELRATNRHLEGARQEMLRAAITDPLTGCHNRRFLDTIADRELRRHDRFGLPLSLLYVDVNRFKQINDTLGHDAGDRVLRYVARFLKRHIREADYVFRLGGDEFLVLMTCGGEEATRKAAALKANFDSSPNADELPPGVGLSVGAVEVPRETTDLTPLIQMADERMYADKGERGKAGRQDGRKAEGGKADGRGAERARAQKQRAET